MRAGHESNGMMNTNGSIGAVNHGCEWQMLWDTQKSASQLTSARKTDYEIRFRQPGDLIHFMDLDPRLCVTDFRRVCLYRAVINYSTV